MHAGVEFTLAVVSPGVEKVYGKLMECIAVAAPVEGIHRCGCSGLSSVVEGMHRCGCSGLCSVYANIMPPLPPFGACPR